MEHSVGREVVVGRAGCGAAWPQSSGRGGWVRVRASARRARRRRNAAMSGTARLADGGGAARAPAHRGSRAARTNGPRRGLRKRGPSAPPPALPAPRARAGACGALTESRRAPPGGAGCSRSRSSAAWWCLRERACAGIAHGTTAHVFHVEPERRRPVRAADGSAGGGGGAGAIGGGREWGPLVRAGRGRRCAGARAAPAPVESRAAPAIAALRRRGVLPGSARREDTGWRPEPRARATPAAGAADQERGVLRCVGRAGRRRLGAGWCSGGKSCAAVGCRAGRRPA